MPDTPRLWLEISHHPVFAVGGWAFVRADGGVTGMAGGERRTDLERIALAGLISALKAASGGGPVRLLTASPAVLAVPGRIRAALAGEDPPTANLDLWAQAMTLLQAGSATIAAAASAAGTPTAFAAGWALYARDKAKAAGAFTAAIPKSNLAKAGV